MSLARLQKIIAQAGICSRRAAEKLVLAGRIKVNGRVVKELGAKADLKVDKVEISGYGELGAEALVYIALHKPEHVVSTVRDPEGRPTVLKLLEKSRAVGKRIFEGELPRVYPVGRLDFDAEGLLLLTNDGDLAYQLTHPKMHVPKVYMVKVKGRPTAEALQALRDGVRLRREDGTLSRRTAPALVRVVKESPRNTWLELTLFEGRNHQVKLMCSAIRYLVLRLIRVEFGGIILDDLPTGAWRFLSTQEIKTLKAFAQKTK